MQKENHGYHGPLRMWKSTLLRAINRMHELYPDIKTTGEIL
ncbi:MAG: hypothetical protein ACLU4N_06055 [Butyricimonas faecihominis]